MGNLVGLGTQWHLPKRNGGYYKRPFATTTFSDGLLVEVLGSLGITWDESRSVPYLSDELKLVIDTYVNEGYGAEPIREFVRSQ